MNYNFVMNNKKDDRLTYFIDLDGTLFDKRSKNRISTKNISTILLLKNFANVVISTGRSYNDHRVKQTLYLLGLKDIICSSGAQVYIDDELKYTFYMDNDLVKDIASYCIDNKILFVVFDESGESIYVQSAFAKWLNATFLRKKFKIIDYAKNFKIENHKNVSKMAFVLKNNKGAPKELNNFQLLFKNKTNSYLASANYVIEITDGKTNKGIAESLYMKEYNIKIDDAIHIGDSDADASVKGYVGKIIAMKNSSTTLKVLADEIGPNYKNGGIYKYFTSKKKRW